MRDGNLSVNKLLARVYTSNVMSREMDDMTWVVDIDILTQRVKMGTSCEPFCC